MTVSHAHIEGQRHMPSASPALIIGFSLVVGVLAYTTLINSLLGAELPTFGVLGVFAAATVSSVAGFAFSALCGPVLAHAGPEPVRLVQTLMLCSIAIQGWSVFALRHELDLRALFPLLTGGLCALPVGVLILFSLPTSLHATPVGVIILAYGLWSLFRPPIRLRHPPGWLPDVLVGASGGITGGLAAFPGAAVAVWCGLKGWPKEKQRGVTQTYILMMQIAALIVIGMMAPLAGVASLPDATAMAYLPPAVLGAACGLRVFRTLTDRQFGRAVSLLLVAGGLAMVT